MNNNKKNKKTEHQKHPQFFFSTLFAFLVFFFFLFLCCGCYLIRHRASEAKMLNKDKSYPKNLSSPFLILWQLNEVLYTKNLGWSVREPLHLTLSWNCENDTNGEFTCKSAQLLINYSLTKIVRNNVCLCFITISLAIVETRMSSSDKKKVYTMFSEERTKVSYCKNWGCRRNARKSQSTQEDQSYNANRIYFLK